MSQSLGDTGWFAAQRFALPLALMVTLFVVACAPTATQLDVQLVTDYDPGRDFDTIVVTIDGQSSRSPALTDHSYGRARRVLTLERASADRVSLTLGLERAGRLLQVQPRVVTPVAGQVNVVTFLITRDCEDIECPGAAAPDAIACIGGVCVNPGCTAEYPALCPMPPCPEGCEASTVPCVARVCRGEGVCFSSAEDERCGASEICSTQLGCIAADGFDAGSIEAGPREAGAGDADSIEASTSDGSVTEAGSIDGAVDAGSLDVGSLDAGSLDAGSLDAGSLDAGATDTGEMDAGSSDAGETDAGSSDVGEMDAGSSDAGEMDAGDIDAGDIDAGDIDAGPADTGPVDAGPPDAAMSDVGVDAAIPGSTLLVTTTAASGPGSLAAAIALENGCTSGPYRIRFDLPRTDPGFRPSGGGGGVWTFAAPSTVRLLCPETVIDGGSQTAVDDSNPGTLGTTIGTVGVDALPMLGTPRPEIDLSLIAIFVGPATTNCDSGPGVGDGLVDHVAIRDVAIGKLSVSGPSVELTRVLVGTDPLTGLDQVTTAQTALGSILCVRSNDARVSRVYLAGREATNVQVWFQGARLAIADSYFGTRGSSTVGTVNFMFLDTTESTLARSFVTASGMISQLISFRGRIDGVSPNTAGQNRVLDCTVEGSSVLLNWLVSRTFSGGESGMANEVTNTRIPRVQINAGARTRVENCRFGLFDIVGRQVAGSAGTPAAPGVIGTGPYTVTGTCAEVGFAEVYVDGVAQARVATDPTFTTTITATPGQSIQVLCALSAASSLMSNPTIAP